LEDEYRFHDRERKTDDAIEQFDFVLEIHLKSAKATPNWIRPRGWTRYAPPNSGKNRHKAHVLRDNRISQVLTNLARQHNWLASIRAPHFGSSFFP